MGVALFDEDGSKIEGEPYVPVKRISEKSLANLEKGRRAAGFSRPRTYVDGRAWLRRLIDSTEYRKNFRQRLLAGELAPALEVMVYHYALGKPKETHEIIASISNTTVALEKLNDQQLALLREMLQGTAVLRTVEEVAAQEALDAQPSIAAAP